jgi:hypothetical protein
MVDTRIGGICGRRPTPEPPRAPHDESGKFCCDEALHPSLIHHETAEVAMDERSSFRRRRVARGIYQQPNGKYAVCVRVDGRARFRTLEAATLVEALRQRELLQRLAHVGELPLSPGLTFGEVAARWLAEFEAKMIAGERRDRTFDLYRSQLHRHLLPRLGRRLLVPEEVRRGFMLPPGVTACENVLRAYGSLRGRDWQTTENSSAPARASLTASGITPEHWPNPANRANAAVRSRCGTAADSRKRRLEEGRLLANYASTALCRRNP